MRSYRVTPETFINETPEAELASKNGVSLLVQFNMEEQRIYYVIRYGKRSMVHESFELACKLYNKYVIKYDKKGN